MALAQSTAQSLLDHLTSLIDANGGGDIVLRDSGDSTLCTIDFASDSYPAASWDSGNGWADTDISSAINANASGTGDIDDFIIRDGATTTILDGTAGDAGTEDIVFDNESVTSGQNVEITSLELRQEDA